MAMKTAAFLAAFAFCTNSHAAGEVNVLLPSPDYYPGQRARDVLVDPFNAGPAAGVFVGLWGDTRPNVLRLTPVDAESSAFALEEVDGGLSSVFGLAYNPNEGIYAGGNSREQYTRRDATSVWTVRRSSYADQGNLNTWKDDDRFYFTTFTTKGKNKSVTVHYSNCHDLTSDHTGAMFATGSAYNGSSDEWVIRRKLLGGAWETVRNVATGNINMNPGLCSFPGNTANPPAVFAVGDEGFRWAVLRSIDGGGTWEKVDEWIEGPAQSAAVDVAVDADGNIYVVGYRGVNGTNPSSWTVRRSSQRGDRNTWQTMLDVPGPTVTASVNLTVDSTGAVVVSGSVSDGTNPFFQIVRCTKPDNAAAWTEAFSKATFPFPGTRSSGGGIAADSFGNIFAGGAVRDWTDENNTFYSGARAALVRIVPPPSSMPAESAFTAN
jgi:hypothetical protein